MIIIYYKSFRRNFQAISPQVIALSIWERIKMGFLKTALWLMLSVACSLLVYYEKPKQNKVLQVTKSLFPIGISNAIWLNGLTGRINLNFVAVAAKVSPEEYFAPCFSNHLIHGLANRFDPWTSQRAQLQWKCKMMA